MPLSQRSETESQDLGRLDRRTVLKLYAASLSTTALGTGLRSCASGTSECIRLAQGPHALWARQGACHPLLVVRIAYATGYRRCHTDGV